MTAIATTNLFAVAQACLAECDAARKVERVPAEHAAITEAIAAGNPRLAEAATIVHLHRSLSHVKATHASHHKEHHG